MCSGSYADGSVKRARRTGGTPLASPGESPYDMIISLSLYIYIYIYMCIHST